MAEQKPTRSEAIFAAAIEIADLAARQAYLDRTCGGDGHLRREVDLLLAAHAGAEADDFLGKQPTLLREEVATALSANREEQSGDRIDRYKLLEPIGEGGFGVVWMAEQQEPVRRRVALKVIKLGMDTKQVIARFEAERQALALMDHPNIAKVLDGGTTGGDGGEAQNSKFKAQIPAGRPYFVMELIKGVPITEYCDRERLDPRERLELFIQVCQGVQHAHQKGVIHRDLKPSNILVAVHDDQPVPKIIDFGIAKATQQPLTEQTVFTRFQQLVGTPAYMSPEQAGMSSIDVDTRSDVYALGVLLYELLTGRTPFSKDELLKAGFEEMCRVIREKEPPKPSTKLSSLGVEELKRVAQQRKAEPQKLGRLVRGELDWIVLKAMEKDRARRYETANGLARDVERYLNEEPVTAVAPSMGYQMAKFARRHRTALATAAAFALVLLVASVISTWQAVLASRLANDRDRQFRVATNATARATASLAESEKARHATESALYANRIRLAYQAWEVGDVAEAERLLALCPTNLQHWEWRHLKSQCRQYETRFQVATNEPWDFDEYAKLIFLRDPERLMVKVNGDLSVFDPATGKRLPDLEQDSPTTNGSKPTTDASVTEEKWVAEQTTNGLRVIKVSDARTFRDITGSEGYNPIRVSDDGKWMAAWRGTNTIVVEVMAGRRVLEIVHNLGSPFRVWFHSGTDFMSSVHKEGSGDFRDTAEFVLWNLRERTRVFGRKFPGLEVTVTAHVQEGGFLVVGGWSWQESASKLVLLDVRTGDEIEQFRVDNGAPHEFRVAAGGLESSYVFGYIYGLSDASVTEDGRYMSLAVMDRTVRLLDLGSRVRPEILRGHRGGVISTAIRHDGGRIASLDTLGEVLIWDNTRRKPLLLPHQADDSWFVNTVLPGNADLVCWSHERRVLVYSLLTHETTLLPEVPPQDYLLLDQNLLTTPTGAFDIWSGLQVPGPTIQKAVAHSPDGSLVATVNDGQMQIHDRHTGERLGGTVTIGEVPTTDFENLWRGTGWLGVCFSPDSSRVAVALGGEQRRVVVYRTRSFGAPTGLICDFQGDRGIEFSPDGKWLLAGHAEREFVRVDAESGQVVGRFAITDSVPMEATEQAFKFSPDGRFVIWLAGRARLIEISTGRAVVEFGLFTVPAFSPDSRRVVGAGRDGLLHIWDLDSQSDLATLNYPTMLARFIGDGSSVLVISPEGEVTVLDSGPPSAEVLALAETQRAKKREREARLAAERQAEAEAIRRGIPAREAQLDVRLVDLSNHYTAAFSTNWHGDEIGNNLRDLPTGRQRFGGVDFDVRGLVQAPEAGPGASALPSTNIVVGQTCRRLHFLHAAIKAAGLTNGTVVGRYVVRYADGQRAEIPLRIGVELADWWNQPGPPPLAPEVWRGRNAKAQREAGRHTRLFHLAWENPHPAVRVEAVDLVATAKEGLPFLVGLTTE